MRYYIDTEFIEGVQTHGNPFLSFFIGSKQPPKPTIDLISIGIVSEDGREYYAISKDFNLKEAWNRYDLDYGSGDQRNKPPTKVYWIRENVLKPIMFDLLVRNGEIFFEEGNELKGADLVQFGKTFQFIWGYRTLKRLLKKYGKANKQIAQEVKHFVGYYNIQQYYDEGDKPEFYGYYADYDWVVFAWLFGKMVDLPKGFPFYCKDLKQTLDEKQEWVNRRYRAGDLKKFAEYPKQTNEHNALADARWNKQLHDFLTTL